jgi:hypothetical protein
LDGIADHGRAAWEAPRILLTEEQEADQKPSQGAADAEEEYTPVFEPRSVGLGCHAGKTTDPCRTRAREFAEASGDEGSFRGFNGSG